ncbi:unnamed protein product [Arabis nemorensis]|uniref:F-box associated domain-containing protein n=1 Tax=Arabis nemorensis TaxID=586526 RepID=A0A565CGI3_9BRAS|nr:unnamed protein product [Arabis nemorensis]
MCCLVGHVLECSVLDVGTGDWQMLSPPRYKVHSRRKSVCEWIDLLATKHWDWLQNTSPLDLHKEDFNNVPVLPVSVTQETTQLVNLEDRLAIASTYTNPEWKLEIWSMDTKEERLSKTYSIHLVGKGIFPEIRKRRFTPIVVSKQGNLVFYDNYKRLFKCYPKTDDIRCLSSDTCVISPFFENLAPLENLVTTLVVNGNIWLSC